MRIDVVTIFPDYLAPLDLSLLGRARSTGLLSLHVHDLRTWTHDRHHTVDDTPYGGGPGMVMRPEPWGDALDAILASDPDRTSGPPTLVVPTPAGAVFTQDAAERLAKRPWLVFACGRYEGIDQRVVDHYVGRLDVVEVSIGDYVLGGGEAAAIVVIEAVARLVPGIVGNPDSLVEESHTTGERAGLLEYPVYTKPPSWRGLDVPPVLLSGHHDRIASWRRGQAIRRTAERRPDLAHPSQALTLDGLDTEAEVRQARPADAGELLTLQRCCWVSEAQLNDVLELPALVEDLADVRRGLDEWLTLVVRVGGRLVASVRARLDAEDRWEIGRLMVVPDLEGRGLGRWLLQRIEQAAPAATSTYTLFTGARSARNLRMYRRAGYRLTGDAGPVRGAVMLQKPARRPSGR